MTCAANHALEAIFDQPVGSAGTSSGGKPGDKASDGTTQLVVDTVRG